MKNSTKIIIVLAVLALGGFTFAKWQKNRNKPTIKIVSTNQTTKEVAFKMSYKDKSFATTVKLGGIRKQILGDYTFAAITQGENIVLSIKDNTNKVLTSKTVTFG